MAAHLSASQIEGWSQCGERFRLERIEKVPQSPAWFFIGGHAIHAAFEDIVQESLSPDEAEEAFLHHFTAEIAETEKLEPDRTKWRVAGRKSKAFPDKENFDWWWENGVKQSRRFAVIQQTPFLPGDPAEINGKALTEIEFMINIGRHQVKGFIDIIIVTSDGRYIPRDYKAGSMRPASALQVAIYAEAIRQMFGMWPTTGEYLMTRDLEEKITQARIPMDLASWGATELERQLDMLALAKEHGIYLPHPSNLCSACGVGEHCKFRQEPK